jgi:hypothetical protein
LLINQATFLEMIVKAKESLRAERDNLIFVSLRAERGNLIFVSLQGRMGFLRSARNRRGNLLEKMHLSYEIATPRSQ